MVALPLPLLVVVLLVAVLPLPMLLVVGTSAATKVLGAAFCLLALDRRCAPPSTLLRRVVVLVLLPALVAVVVLVEVVPLSTLPDKLMHMIRRQDGRRAISGSLGVAKGSCGS